MKSWMLFPVVLVLMAGTGVAAPVPFSKGVNLSGWFQPEQAGRIPFSRYGEQDFRNLKALGVDGVRLPINFEGLTGPGPDYRIDPRVFPFLDQAVNWAEAHGMAIVLDNHSDPTKPRIKKDLGRFLEAVWTQMAAQYKNRSAKVLYEIQNEPHDLGQSWAPLQQRAISAVRAVDQVHTIVVGGDDWNSIKGMRALPKYADDNLIYTFHYYDPFVVTHQGASWTDLKDLAGVAFPPHGKIPNVSGKAPSWVSTQVRDYYGRNPVPGMAASLDSAAAFGKERNVPVWCGELGVYNLKAAPEDRVEWYRVVRSLLEERRIPWTSWDYKDAFGLFNKDSAEVFEQDLNLPLVEALGFNAVPQKAVGAAAQKTGFVLYADSWQNAREGGYNNKGTVDYADADRPRSGSFSIKVAGIDRYDVVAWTFAPWKDLTALADKASLSLWARASGPFSVEVRFVDSAAPGALPWRNAATVDSSQVPPDGQWHQVKIPLSSLKVTGAWDGTWHPGQPGAFEWNRVERLEIVPEQGSLAGVTLGFDDIAVD